MTDVNKIVDGWDKERLEFGNAEHIARQNKLLKILAQPSLLAKTATKLKELNLCLRCDTSNATCPCFHYDDCFFDMLEEMGESPQSDWTQEQLYMLLRVWQDTVFVEAQKDDNNQLKLFTI